MESWFLFENVISMKISIDPIIRENSGIYDWQITQIKNRI